MVSYFNFFYLYFQQEIKFSQIHLAMICVSKMIISKMIYKMSRILITYPFKYLSCNFVPVFGWQHLYSWAYSCLLLFISTRQVGLICVSIFKSRKFCLSFCLVNSECHAYLIVDHSFIATLKCFYCFSA